MVQVPDGVAPILAARLWRVDGVRLRAAVKPAGWTVDAPTRAVCLGAGGHEAPAPSCMCGLWGLVDAAELRRYAPYYGVYGDVVSGVVALWGRVIPGSRGWRAEYGQPVALVQRPSGREWMYARLLGLPCLDAWPRLTQPVVRAVEWSSAEMEVEG